MLFNFKPNKRYRALQVYNAEFVYLWNRKLTLTWLYSFLLVSAPTDLFSERDFRTCRSGLETGRPVTLIPSEITQQHTLTDLCKHTPEHSRSWGGKEDHYLPWLIRAEENITPIILHIKHIRSPWGCDHHSTQSAHSLHPPFNPHTHLFVQCLMRNIKIRNRNVTVWKMMRWKNFAINEEIKCAAMEHGFIFPAHKLTNSSKREPSWLFLVTEVIWPMILSSKNT